MPHEVTLGRTGDFIRMRAYGHVTKSDILQTEKDVLTLHLENGVNRVLIDHREVESFFGVLDMFDIGIRIPQSRFQRIAMIVNEINEDYQFLETVAVNRGGNLKMFTTEESALAWLTGSAESVRQLDAEDSK